MNLAVKVALNPNTTNQPIDLVKSLLQHWFIYAATTSPKQEQFVLSIQYAESSKLSDWNI